MRRQRKVWSCWRSRADEATAGRARGASLQLEAEERLRKHCEGGLEELTLTLTLTLTLMIGKVRSKNSKKD